MEEVDSLDAEILRQLLEDGRKSFVEIAKDCNVSKDVISKRFNQMKQAGIIVGSTIQMNYKLFGYDTFASIYIDVKPEHLNIATDALRNIPNTREIMTIYNHYNLCAIMNLKNMRELDRVKGAIRNQIPVNALKTQIWYDIKNIPENLFNNASKKVTDKDQTVKLQETKDDEKEFCRIDEMDIKIVEKLRINSRLPFSKIAQELGTSTDTVIRRYEKLKDQKAIKAVIQINPAKIGYKGRAAFFISVISQSYSANSINELSKIKGVYHIVKTSGVYDYFVLACIRSIEHFLSIREQIAELPDFKIVEIRIEQLSSYYPLYSTYISTFN